MRIEHKLSPVMVEYMRQAVKQLQEYRNQWLAAMGAAKEIEMKRDSLDTSITQQVVLIQRTESLPQPIGMYQLSADCEKLIGEVPDVAPQPPAPVAEPAEPVAEQLAAAEAPRVNGAVHEQL